MDIQFDKIMDNADIFAGFMESADVGLSPEEVAEKFKNVDGLKIEGKKVVTAVLKSGAGEFNENEPLAAPLRTGSGFFVGNKGYFVTNEHVIQNAKSAKILLGSEVLAAKVIHVSKAADLALLRVESLAQGLQVLDGDIEVGTDIYTIGFPNPGIQGTDVKITKGIISNKRGFNGDDTRFQIDAAIQPGNSGGPVCDASGKVLGVVVSTLDSIMVAKETGAIPQNVNYGIKSSELLAFLRSRSVDVGSSGNTIVNPANEKADFRKATSSVGLVIITE
jgi:S1-C subfamily serine protease